MRVEHDDPRPRRGEQRAVHEAERARAQDRHGVAHRDDVERVHHAPQRLGERGDPQVEPGRHPMQVALHDPRRHQHLLREPAEHRLSRPRTHERHAPHGAESPQNTRSPTATDSTPAPAAATTPANSWPSGDG